MFLAMIALGISGLAANAAVRFVQLRRTARRFREAMRQYMKDNNYPED